MSVSIYEIQLLAIFTNSLLQEQQQQDSLGDDERNGDCVRKGG